MCRCEFHWHDRHVDVCDLCADIRILSDEKEIKVTYNGMVTQNSGEDWTNCRMVRRGDCCRCYVNSTYMCAVLYDAAITLCCAGAVHRDTVYRWRRSRRASQDRVYLPAAAAILG